nr:pectinesterase/pectinesterase inhibitor U1 [Ipomoea batatas]
MARLGDPTARSKAKKKIFLAVFASCLLAATVIGVVVGVKSRKSNSGERAAQIHPLTAAAHAIVKSSCTATLYPDLCYSAIANVSGASDKVRSQKDVIEMSLNITTTAVEQNYFVIEKLLKTRKGLTEREKTALHDCLEMIDETIDELHETEKDLEAYPNKKTLKQHADDLKTLVSAAITNQETCLDGFSHGDADKHVRQVLLKGQAHVEKMCSNALAMIKNMTDTDIAAEEMKLARTAGNRKLSEQKWPEWLSVGDRKLLQSSTVTPNVVVAADGSGDHKTVSEAVAKAPEKSSKRYIIKIKAGVYRENVEIGKKKTNLMLIGDGRKNTIITGNRNVKDGSTTFHSATVGKHISPSFCLKRPLE